MYPRDEISRIGDADFDDALTPLSWAAIKARIEQLDHCAVGGVSADATLIAALCVRIVKPTATFKPGFRITPLGKVTELPLKTPVEANPNKE